MVNSYKKSIDEEKIQVNPPVKNEHKQWVCNVSYDSSPFLIQSPRIRIIKETGTLIFKVDSKKEFLDYLSSVEDSISKNIYDNSERFFSGKKFSLEKITNSMSPSWDIDDVGFVYLQPSNKEEDLTSIKCADMFNNEISYEKLQENVSVILHVESVLFTKKMFKVMYKIHRLKMTKFVESRSENPFEEDKIEEVVSKLDISDEKQENLEEHTEEENLEECVDDETRDFFD